MDFVFDGEKLSDHGFIICEIDGQSNESEIVSQLNYNTIKAPLSNTTRKISSSYDTNLNKNIKICKNPCYDDDLYIDAETVSEMVKWLCRDNYKSFKWVYDKRNDNKMDEIIYYVKFDINKIILNGKCIGLELAIESNRPYGLTKEISLNIHGNEFDITVFSDDYSKYIYPDITITLLSSGDLSIINTYDNSETTIKNCSDNEVIYLSGDILQISSNINRNFSEDFNYVFPHLCNDYHNSTNHFSINIPCDIKISYRGIRKVGL